MEEILHYLEYFQKLCKWWEKLPTSTGERWISEPSTVPVGILGQHLRRTTLCLGQSRSLTFLQIRWGRKFCKYVEIMKCLFSQHLVLLQGRVNVNIPATSKILFFSLNSKICLFAIRRGKQPAGEIPNSGETFRRQENGTAFCIFPFCWEKKLRRNLV